MFCRISGLLFLSLFSAAVFGHDGHEHASGFAAGMAHPFMGLDHLLAMLALGVWAAQREGARKYIAPSIFIVSMLLGAFYALNGGALPFVEHGIALSVIVLGILVAAVPANGFSAAVALPLIAAGAAMHGYAHGTEAPAGTRAVEFVAAFSIATALLHALGAMLGAQLNRRIALRRAVGLAVTLAGSVLTFGLQ